MKYLYFQNVCGGAHSNTQVRIGLDESDNVLQCVTVGYNCDETSYVSVGMDAWLNFCSLNSIGWFGESSADKFATVALLCEPISKEQYAPYFEKGIKLP